MTTAATPPLTIAHLEALLKQLEKSQADNTKQGLAQFEQHIVKLTTMLRQLNATQLSADEQQRLSRLKPKVDDLITHFSTTKTTLHEQLDSVASRRKAIRGYGRAQKGEK